METKKISLDHFLSTAFDHGDYTTDDVIAIVLPIARQMSAIHETGMVISLDGPGVLTLTGRTPGIHAESAAPPSEAIGKINALFADLTADRIDVVRKITISAHSPQQEDSEENLRLHLDTRQPLRYAAYLPGYASYETLLGHHDPQTDIFSLGLILGSLSLSLNLNDEADLRHWAAIRANPAQHNARIHPTLARLITEMTELDRRRRSQDLYDIIRRLENYREHEAGRQDDLSLLPGWRDTDLSGREAFILNKLRNRLFDTTRRNKLLFFKPSGRFVNLTVGSVPIVLHYQSIRADHLFTWNEDLAEKITNTKEIVLNKYLRFEDHPYLPAALDRLRVESRRSIQEFGLSQLKLVIVFLSWHNLKEDPGERIQSPLLLIPAELRKNKRLKEDHYVLKALDNAAEVNPVLAGQLKELYGIRLPEHVDLDEMSLRQFYELVRGQIEAANQGLSLQYIDRPRIMLIQREARQNLSNYKKRLGFSASPTDPAAPVSASGSSSASEPVLPSESAAPTEFASSTEASSSSELISASEDISTSAPASPAEPAESPSTPPSRQHLEYELVQSDNNPYSWDFDSCNMVLGNFNYKKMSLVRDYNLVIDQQLSHGVFDELFSTQPRELKQHGFDLNRPDDWFHVIQADPTQTKAILQSRTGYSYIIQGPPGTGKSQTITNLIADFVARGKTILFVCEKRAALDVVFHRLKQNGLDELCCYIHDSQGDKKEFIRNLGETYESFLANKLDLTAIRNRRSALLEQMNRQISLIETFHLTSTGGEKEQGIRTRQLIDKIIALRQELPAIDARTEEGLPSFTEWQGSQSVIQDLSQTLVETGAQPIFAQHPFSRVRDNVFLADNPLQLLDNLVSQALSKLEELAAFTEASDGLETLKTRIQYATLLHPLASTGNLALADASSPAFREFSGKMADYRTSQSAVQDAAKKNEHWRQKIAKEELEACIALATTQERRFFSFLNGSWRKLKQHLDRSYDFAAHVVRPAYGQVLGNLNAEYEAQNATDRIRQGIQQAYRLDSLDTNWLSIGLLHNKRGDPQLDSLLTRTDAVARIASLHGARQSVSQLEDSLRGCCEPPLPETLQATRTLLTEIKTKVNQLPALLPALRPFTALSETVRAAVRNLPFLPIQLEAAVARKTLHEVYQHNKQFQTLDRQAIAGAAGRLGQAYTELQQLNADLLRASVRQRFQQDLDLAGMAAAQLNDEQKKLKKIINDGRKILENEFGKSMRYKSIRELSEKDSGRLLRTIKPIWLMSPYSVSDSLPLDSGHFDVVIFDEASQITLEEGVPALYRSQQAIIVGDEKQMPPTDFFNGGANQPDPGDLQDDEDPAEWLQDDIDSLLAQGSRKLDNTLLSWHYRSHYETLISFSNHAFYGGELLTIPDRSVHHGAKEPIRITSPEDAVRNVGQMMDRSISYHLHTSGLYERRSNRPEAAYIAHLVRELLSKDPKTSIGVVAFSQQQQQTIEEALDLLAVEDSRFAQQLEEAYNRTEQDQFVGLIIKNLENIQGDERDVIIMSVCYGRDARGKMLMNFGPINKRGGEKRLNVLFSRAKKHIAVVSSIQYQDITNEYNDGANYLRRFLHYAEMVSTGNMQMAGTILRSLVVQKEKRTKEIDTDTFTQQLKKQIEFLGYEVTEQVGQSGFKCSLAVKAHPGDDHYSLGILVDDETHYQNPNLIEQYYLRPGVMRLFGWNLLTVFAKDWLHQPQKILDQIQKALQEKV